MNLIKGNDHKHVSLDAVREFEDAIIKEGILHVIERKNNFVDLLFKIFKRIYIDGKVLRMIRPFVCSKSDNFTILMGPHFSKCIPCMLSKGKNGIYLYDAWPEKHSYIDEIIRSLNLKFIYFSSKRVAEIYADKFKDKEIKWIPEAIKLDDYCFEDYKNKNIDIIQIGRKYDLYHDVIVDTLEKSNIIYLYERNKGEIIFPKRDDFITALAKTKISICVPSSVTHKERAGDISSVTLRYWQSMASKCLILGIMPEEMKYLFDYKPIIDINMDDPVGQINSILNNFELYIPLIEKNYLHVNEHHTWTERLKIMNQIY